MLNKKPELKVDWVTDGEDAYSYIDSYHYDIIILDWMMPGASGIEICKVIRKNGYNSGILMLTARGELSDRVEGLDAGADDYLIKPFEFDELFARIRALSRRNNAAIKKDIVNIKGFIIDHTNYTINYNGKEIRLTPREFNLLDLLVQNRGQIVTREIIFDRVWGHDADVTNNAIDASIKLLRKKIDISKEETLIKSIRGVGFKFEI
jgi:DNA-binding response OmpR family regulator